MNTHPKISGELTENYADIGSETLLRIQERAYELAVTNGRPAHDVSDAEWKQAMRELAASEVVDPNLARREAVPGSTGHPARANADLDEDDGGRSANRRLVQKSIADA